MLKSKKIFICLILGMLSFPAYAGGFSDTSVAFSTEATNDIKAIEILINEKSKVKLNDAPTTGYLEIYTILGVKIKSINIKTISGVYALELPKGLYIVRAGKVAQKVMVK